MNLLARETLILLRDDVNRFTVDLANDELTRLNDIPARVLELADGTKSAEEILKIILPEIGQKNLEKARRWIEKAIENGSLVESDTAAQATERSGAELDAIAARLRAEDKVRMAWLVQKRAVELAPAEPMHWYRLAELSHIMGRRDETRAAYEEYFRHHPEDPETAHILKALRNEVPPKRASDEFIDYVYRRFASYYEETMCGDLNFAAPDHLFEAIKNELGSETVVASAADMGCGTGLFGLRLRKICKKMIGIDLSAEMLAIARGRGIYDELVQAEITQWLEREPAEAFFLITFCDTLIYFGSLETVLAGCMKHLKPGGLLAFTLEKSETPPLRLSDSGRYQHQKNYVRETARKAGFEVIHRSEKVLRKEYGSDVVGLVTVLKKPVAAAS
ncbi:MAG: methyltransferase domain-containing protein [bacterium]